MSMPVSSSAPFPVVPSKYTTEVDPKLEPAPAHVAAAETEPELEPAPEYPAGPAPAHVAAAAAGPEMPAAAASNSTDRYSFAQKHLVCLQAWMDISKSGRINNPGFAAKVCLVKDCIQESRDTIERITKFMQKNWDTICAKIMNDLSQETLQLYSADIQLLNQDLVGFLTTEFRRFESSQGSQEDEGAVFQSHLKQQETNLKSLERVEKEFIERLKEKFWKRVAFEVNQFTPGDLAGVSIECLVNWIKGQLKITPEEVQQFIQEKREDFSSENLRNKLHGCTDKEVEQLVFQEYRKLSQELQRRFKERYASQLEPETLAKCSSEEKKELWLSCLSCIKLTRLQGLTAEEQETFAYAQITQKQLARYNPEELERFTQGELSRLTVEQNRAIESLLQEGLQQEQKRIKHFLDVL